MRVTTKAKAEQGRARALLRRVSDLRAIASQLERLRITPLQVCEAIIEKRFAVRTVREFFADLPDEERHYWIASLYALLMPAARRKRLAAYFTPPHLAHHAIRIMTDAGIRPGHHRILDPASGGAAFLVPLAAQIADAGHRRGARAKKILHDIHTSLHGVEIDGGLAGLSHALLTDLLRHEIKSSGINVEGLVQRADALQLEPPANLYDAVIGNPPYGRILRPRVALLGRYHPVVANGYVNLYALFVEQALQCVRPGGIVCLIIPTSFVGGPHFAALRQRILETASILRLDLIDKRSDVFLDVLYDLCVVLLRKSGGPGRPSMPKSSLLRLGEPSIELGNLVFPPVPNKHVWALPDANTGTAFFGPGFATLADYGYLTKTGYFVWNREQHRYRTGRRPRGNEVPLFWAHNIRPNKRCLPQDGRADAIGFVKISKKNSAIIRSNAVILQRTSNRGQKRRLIAALLLQRDAPGGRGFVTENHTILVLPDPSKIQKLPLRMLCRLLNTASVDARFRRISGSVSLSTKALRELPLPAAIDVRKCFAKYNASDDEAAAGAYAASASRKRAAPNPKKRGKLFRKRRRW